MYIKNTASQNIPFALVKAADGTALTGATVTVVRCIDGGAQAAVTGSVTEKAGGQYNFAPSQADMNGDTIGFLFTATSAIPVHITIPTFAANIPSDVQTIKTQTVTCAAGVTVLASVGTASTSTAQTGDCYARLGAPAGASVSADVAAVKSDSGAIKTKTDYLPSATAGAAGGVFIAGSNAATSITTALTANITGNLSGSVGSVTGAVGSVTGAVGSVTGAVGSVTGNVGGNVAGSVGSVTAAITLPAIPTDWIAAAGVKADAVTKIQNGLATPTNITAGTITTVTNLTNAPTNGDLTATMKLSVTTAASAASPSVTVSDKTGFSLSAAGILAIWNQLTADAGIIANSFGVKLKNWVLGTDNKSLVSTDAQDLSATFKVDAKVVEDKTGYALTSAYDAAKTAATQASVNALPQDKTGYTIAAGGIPVGAFSAGAITDAAVASDAEAAIANAVIGSVVEVQGSYTLKQVQSIILSVLAGQTADGGIIIKTPNGAATRVTATVDGSNNRTAMTISPSA